METVNDRIAFLIETLCITKTAFAEKIGLSQAFISNICAGKVSPSERTITDICREYGVSKAWLMDGVKPMLNIKPGDEEISNYFSSLKTDADTDLQRKIILLMSKLPPETWSIIAQKAREVALEFPKDEKKE